MSARRWLKLKSLSELVAAPEIDAAHQAERLRFMERDIGLPVRLVVLSILFYYIFLSDWFEGLNNIGKVALEIVQRFFLVYVAVNVGAAAVYIFMHRLPFHVVRWVAFTVNLIDGLFIGVLTLVTGGLESIAYWVFLALMARNAFSFPVASLQVWLNLLMICCYLFAGFMDKTLTDFEQPTLEMEERLLSPQGGERAFGRATENPVTGRHAARDLTPRSAIGVSERERATEYLLLRISLLLLMTACCYGVQVLVDRQLLTQDEARESTARQAQLRAAGRMAAQIAHQIKNPLGIINNAAYSLQKALLAGKVPVTQQIQIIREEVNRADTIITKLMGYAQLAEGRVEKLKIAEELDRAIVAVFPPAAHYDVQIEKDYAAALPPLLMQRGHLSEILVNILLNAREATQGRGQIRVAARPGPGDTVIVAIRDNGPGLPADHVEKVFEPYFSTKEKGTGLGLAIVKNNMEMYGGTARVESVLGKGAEFILHFPTRTFVVELT
jgi:signal transduction histidine kinase